ncbi:MAG: Cof-type HAD-IIB family hydrolase [Clostridiales bacterium]|nr:Cof-type HAD-IIB family hydrolase [Clostridiales bacterium]
MSYRLIALDMDGTLLNSRKEIPPETAEAVRAVCAAGKTVVFDTGRAVSELDEESALLPEVRYAVYASGAGLYDIREKKAFGLRGIPAAQVERILAVARTKDLMPQFVTAYRDVIQASHMENLEHFHMGVYRPLYEKAMTLVPDIFAFAEAYREPFLKINLYHADPQERIRTRAQLETQDLELVYSEVSSLECSARGVNKGSGLERLCGLLGIPMAECIAVGDADNDIEMLRAAGLGVAMDNAAKHVKTAADRVVSDLDHGGCAEAIMILNG